jgi:hypothetical protein
MVLRAQVRGWTSAPRRLQDRAGQEMAMDWVVHYFDRKLNRETVSREHSSKHGALRNACDLMRRQCDVRYIEGPERERVDAPEIYAWCKANRTAERPKDHT